MRVLHLFDHSIPLQSGYTFRSRAILKAQEKRGWKTFQITSGKQGHCSSELEHVDGLDFYRTKPPSGFTRRLPVINQLAYSEHLYRRACEVIEETRPDIIHAHSPALNGLAAIRVGSKMGLPVVYEIRAFWEDASVDHGTSKENGLRYRLSKTLETYVARKAHHITTICEGLKLDLQSRGFQAAKITIIPNAVEAERFEFDIDRDHELERGFGFAGHPVIGFIGSFYAYEGLEDLIRVIPDVLDEIPDVRVLLIGGGPCYEKILALTERLKLGNVVVCTGRVPHDEIHRYYSLIDAFCYPRISMRLTELVTPLKPLEAMAQGKIVIASDVGGHRELITDHKTGYLYKAGDKADFRNTIVSALKNRESWDYLKREGRRFVEEQRNWALSVGFYEDVYEQAQRTFDGK